LKLNELEAIFADVSDGSNKIIVKGEGETEI
jgi:hypothetical protein